MSERIDESKHFYLFYYTPTNFRRVKLIPPLCFPTCKRTPIDLEGFLLTEDEISPEDYDFSIVHMENIEKKYKGRFFWYKDFPRT